MAETTTETRDSREMTEEQEKMAEKVMKLLALAERGGSPEEAASAAQKAQDMLAAYNLDLATIERSGAGKGSAKREDAATAGGQYQYQRDLWRAVARLNFCLYFSTEKRVQRSARRRLEDGTLVDKPRMFYQRQHRLVGRTVNTTLSRTMAQYLEQAVERLCRERYPHQSQFFSRSAVSYRKGIAANICGRLGDRRNLRLAEDERRRKAEMEARMSNVASDTALTLATYIDEETDRNNDFLYGEGWSAKMASRRAESAARLAEQERKQAEWDAAHPEEVLKREKKERAEARARERRREKSGGYGRYRWAASKDDDQAFAAGYRKGAEVGLDPQTDHGSAKTARIA